MFGLSLGLSVVLVVCLLAACAFEFINGFHDTANAVATVIYTKSLKPKTAVAWSGIFNFLGVLTGGVTVAMGIVKLLPLEALLDMNIYHNLAMILALIITAIIWNLGTWYFGIPCSSSHTLIGSIFGVSLAFAWLSDTAVEINYAKIEDAGLALLVSPLIGFSLAFLLMILLKRTVKIKKLFRKPREKKAPPFWIRLTLILTCTGVSYAHGSNDGQKGVGLVMIILICLVPLKFSLDNSKDLRKMQFNVTELQRVMQKTNEVNLSEENRWHYKSAMANIDSLNQNLEIVTANPSAPVQSKIRSEIFTLAKYIPEIIDDEAKSKNTAMSADDMKSADDSLKEIRSYTEYAPWWVIFLISLSLGLGTMIGWQRIVVTIGEKIGNSHLNYAQGASAEAVAFSTIGFSSILGLPVSTTHILSSGIAGTMVAGGGIKNLQRKTVQNILIAWVITVPITIGLSALLYIILRQIFV